MQLKKKITSVLALIVAMTLAFALAACNNKSNGSNGTTDPSASETPRITLSATTLDIAIGETAQLTASGATVSWKTREGDVAASVSDDGIVTGLKVGTAWVIASAAGFHDEYCKVTVRAEQSASAKIYLDGEVRDDNSDAYKLNLPVGDKYTLRPYLQVGADRAEGVTFELECSAGITADGLTIKADSAITEGGSVIVKCTYGEETYTLMIAVTAGSVN